MNTAQISTRWKINLVLLPGSKRRLVQSTFTYCEYRPYTGKVRKGGKRRKRKIEDALFSPFVFSSFRFPSPSPKKCLIKNAILQYWPNVLHVAASSLGVHSNTSFMDMCGAKGSGFFRSWSEIEQGIALYGSGVWNWVYILSFVASPTTTIIPYYSI